MKYYLAQVNIGRILAPIESPIMADFVNNLDEINALAESSPGFIWRLKDDANNATSIHVFDDQRILINMSVWETADDLYQFTYKTVHTEYLKRRKEWFEKMDQVYYALWYVPVGHLPTPEEAKHRLEYLQAHGETPYAFTFRKQFEPVALD
jgi:hypothetical protein